MANIFFFILLIDLLIAPYLQFFIIPMGLLAIIFLPLFINITIKLDRYVGFFAVIFFSVIISAFLSFFRPSASIYLLDNFKYSMQFISLFLYFFIFRWYAMKKMQNDKFIISALYIFAFWYVLLAIFYVVNPIYTIDLIKFIYGRTTVNVTDFAFDFRFPYIFQDANTAIYFFLMATGFIYILRPTRINFYLFFVLGAFTTLLSQSTGGLLAWLIMSVLMTADNFKFSFKHFLFLGIAIFLFLTSFYIVNSYFSWEKINFFYDLAYERFTDDDRISSGGGRLHHWLNLFHMYPLPIGRGYFLYDKTSTLPPHSDFLGLIYRYGLLALIPTLLFLFYRVKKLIFIFPAVIIPFLVNSLIDESKFFALYLAFLGLYIGFYANNHEALATK